MEMTWNRNSWSNIAMNKGTRDSGGSILRVAYLEVSGSLESQSEKRKEEDLLEGSLLLERNTPTVSVCFAPSAYDCI